MFDIHIEEFYRDCVKVLHHLYQVFPRKSAVFVEDISGEDRPDEYGVHSDRFLACFGTMLWLAEENYIIYESTIKQEAIDQATLTSKGLNLMASICRDQELLATLQDEYRNTAHSKSNVELMRLLLKHGTSTQLASAMQSLLSKY